MKKYLVGGAVRDQLMGVEPRDFDYVITNATEEEKVRFTQGMYRISKSYEVYQDNLGYEYTFANGTIEQDLARRDFTCNAIAYDENLGVYVDPFHGAKDIEQGVLTMVSAENIAEDPVRAIRGYRMMAVLAKRDGMDIGDIVIDDATKKVLEQYAKQALENAPERCWQEIAKGIKEDAWEVMFYWWSDSQLPWLYHSDRWNMQHVKDADIKAALLLSQVKDSVWREEWLGYGGHKIWKTLSGLVKDMYTLPHTPDMVTSFHFWKKWQKYKDKVQELGTVFEKNVSFYDHYTLFFGEGGLYSQGTQHAIALGIKGEAIKQCIDDYVVQSLQPSILPLAP